MPEMEQYVHSVRKINIYVTCPKTRVAGYQYLCTSGFFYLMGYSLSPALETLGKL